MVKLKTELLVPFENGSFNKLPSHFEVYDLDNSKEVWDAYRSVNSYQIERQESRQAAYNDEVFLEGHFDIRVFWIREEYGLGYGIGDDWKEKKLKLYIFGAPENWQTYRRAFAAQFRGDYS